MENKDLQMLTRTKTAEILLNHFKNRQKDGPDSDLLFLRSYIVKNQGHEISNQDFYQFFHELEDIGAGELITVGSDKEAKFKWYYSCKDIGKQALEPHKHIEIRSLDNPAPRKRGRPFGTRRKPEVLAKPGLYFVFTTKAGNRVQLDLSDAENLVRAVNELKSKLG